jgi:hypothetical protein
MIFPPYQEILYTKISSMPDAAYFFLLEEYRLEVLFFSGYSFLPFCIALAVNKLLTVGATRGM